MKSTFTKIIFLLFMAYQAISQNDTVLNHRCATPKPYAAYNVWLEDYMQKQNQFNASKKTAVVYNIPIIFHIVHSGQPVGTGRNISQAQVNSQITILNKDFRKLNTDFSTWVTQSSFVNVAADCEINFCAAKVSPTGAILTEPGIERINTTAKGWVAPPYQGLNEPGGYIDNTIKAGSFWDPTKYFNVWVLDMNDGILGYAQFPNVPSTVSSQLSGLPSSGGPAYSDGVVINYTGTGNIGSATAPYNKGRTLTHEAGHWLGLFHIWGDDGGACSGSDNVSDTPNQANQSNCPTTSGQVVTDACATTSPGKMYQNYMDYSEDKCLVMFTLGQKARMQACMSACPRRLSLNTSTVCAVPTDLNEPISDIELNIYPSPTYGDVFVNINGLNEQDFTISIINTLGQTVQESKQVKSNGGTFKLDLSDKNSGIYFVTVKSKLGIQTKRIILQ